MSENNSHSAESEHVVICRELKALFERFNVRYASIKLDLWTKGEELQATYDRQETAGVPSTQITFFRKLTQEETIK